jgi:uncharacterized protein YndB with AHSA1/START domain
VIRAPRALVFRYFTDSTRFAAWWGPGSTIDPHPGGAVLIRYPNAVIARGTVEQIIPDERIVFTYGYDDPARPIAPGTTRVTISLRDDEDGTRLDLRHDFADPALRDQHVPGWRYQLSVFANVAANEAHARATELIDQFFSAWNEADAARRRGLLDTVADRRIEFRDSFAATSGVADLADHIAAIHMHMPGTQLERASQPRQSQGAVLVDWIGRRGAEIAARGTNFFEFTPSGRIGCVFGFWS